MTTFLTFDLAGIAVETSAPAPENIIAGTPRFRTWNLDEMAGGLYAGIWEATPGTWRIAYDEWEYFHVLEGYSIVTEDGGVPIQLRAGDRLILRPGFKGTWQVIETTRKDYVIRL